MPHLSIRCYRLAPAGKCVKRIHYFGRGGVLDDVYSFVPEASLASCCANYFCLGGHCFGKRGI